MNKAASKTSKTARRINGLKFGQDSEGAPTRTNASDSAEIGAPKPLEGRLERRKWRRRRDINSLDGLLREHSRLIAALHAGKIPLAAGEILSRAYGRHHLMVVALSQAHQLQAITEQLAAIRGEPRLSGFALPDTAALDEVQS